MDIETVIEVVISVFGIFVCIIAVTRIFGLRTFAKMSSFDFASTIAIGSILAAVIINKNQGVLKGGLALISIIGFQSLFSLMVRRFNWFDTYFTNKPRFLMKNGNILYENLKVCNVGEDDLFAKLREANVHRLQDVQAVIFESTGDISVLHNENDIGVDDIILKDVQ